MSSKQKEPDFVHPMDPLLSDYSSTKLPVVESGWWFLKRKVERVYNPAYHTAAQLKKSRFDKSRKGLEARLRIRLLALNILIPVNTFLIFAFFIAGTQSHIADYYSTSYGGKMYHLSPVGSKGERR